MVGVPSSSLGEPTTFLSSFFMKTPLQTIALILIALAIALGLAEFGSRRLWRKRAASFDERNLVYQFDEEVGWRPTPNGSSTLVGNRPYHVKHNSYGFRDREWNFSQRGPRVMILGDSFMWGFDADDAERFSTQLAKRLPKFSFFNFGVSGYGTDQELLTLRKFAPLVKPSIVLLSFCSENDVGENTHHRVHNGYFKPYFEAEADKLKIAGVPVRKSSRYFLSSHPWLAKSVFVRWVVETFEVVFLTKTPRPPDPTLLLVEQVVAEVRAMKAKPFVLLTSNYPPLVELLEKLSVKFVVLTNVERYPHEGSHWTPQGNEDAAKAVAKLLQP